MNFLRLILLIAMSALLTNCASTPNNSGVIETSEYILDLGDKTGETKMLIKEASSVEIEEDSESDL